VNAVACYTCHADDFAARVNHVTYNFSHTCQTCHTGGTTTWLGATFSHSSLPQPLAACYTCHQTEFTAALPTAASKHVANGFPTTSPACQTCHVNALTTLSWAGTTMQHSQVSSISCYTCHAAEFAAAKPTAASKHTGVFPTTSPACQTCHTSFTAWGPGTVMQHAQVSSLACFTCHAAEYNGANKTVSSNHKTNGFPTASPACQTCHSLAVSGGYVAWTGAVMTGSSVNHALVSSMACVACHNSDFTGAAPTPAAKHVANGFPSTSPACQTCHTAAAASFAAWSGTTMLHAQVAGVACYTCHAGDYATATKTAASNHNANAFPTTSPACETCHAAAVSGGYVAWSGTTMNHTVVSAVACVNCHLAEFNATKPTAASLHTGRFPSTSPACQNCHTTAAASFVTWAGVVMTGSSANHAQVSSISCYTCHTAEFTATKPTPASLHTGRFPTTSPACQNCHTAAAANFTTWAGVVMTGSSPDHALVSSIACYTCHTAEFTASKPTPASLHTGRFPTTSPACQNCHVAAGASFASWNPGLMGTTGHAQVTSITCYTCHMAEFNGALVTPASRHLANGFPTTGTTCQTCHTTAASTFIAWSGVTMTGSSAKHVVVGGATAACQNCHMGEYNTTNNPAHATAGYVASGCSGCHGSTTNWTTWLGATAGHPTGASCVPTHYGASCTNCHPGNNFAFSACTCYTCHEHSPKNNNQTCGTLPTNTRCPAGCN
jgi:hypothetical protein